MPRSALDPTEIPALLPNLILADVGDAGRAIRHRLVGTEIVAAHGFDYTGRTIEQLTTESTVAFTRQLYGLVVTRAVPDYAIAAGVPAKVIRYRYGANAVSDSEALTAPANL